MDKINAKLPPMKRSQLRKTKQTKGKKIKENVYKANVHWNS